MIAAARELEALSTEERCELLRIARESIGAVFGHVAPPLPRLSSPALLATNGAFVTLRAHGELRGCVGNLSPERPLSATVASAARAAAFEDSRFPPLTAPEWQAVEIEISRLSPARPARPEEVVTGVHGLCVIRGPARGLLLPQVAAEHGWDRVQFLRETCRKAGLPPDTWQDPATELRVFEAEVFGDRDVGPDESSS